MNNSLSFAVSERERQAILEELGKTEEDLAENVEIITEWFETQLHLPETPSKNMVEFLIIINDFDLEMTKKRLDAYYTLRSTIPQVFEIANPKLPEMKIVADTCHIIPLPKLVDDKYAVIVVKEKAEVPAELVGHWWTASLLNIFEVRMQEGLILDNILIYDHQNLSMSHIYKLTPTVLMNCFSILEKTLNDKVKVFHFINNPPVLHFLLKVCKTFMKPEMYNKLHLHESHESLAEYIPLDILPKDFGGEERSLDELQELWIAKQKEYQHHFDKLDTLIVDESLRPPSENPLDALFGNFGKLFFQ